MAETHIIVDIPTCYSCGYDKTVSQVAWHDLHPDDEDPPFTSCEKKVAPLTKQTPQVMMTLLTVPGALLHLDYCGKCGAPRMIRAERFSIPASVFQAMLGIQSKHTPLR